VDRPRRLVLDRILRHLQRDSNLLVDSQYLVRHLYLMVYVWTHEHLLAASELEDAMEYTAEEGPGCCQLRHHAYDHLSDGGRIIHISEGAHRHLQRS